MWNLENKFQNIRIKAIGSFVRKIKEKNTSAELYGCRTVLVPKCLTQVPNCPGAELSWFRSVLVPNCLGAEVSSIHLIPVTWSLKWRWSHVNIDICCQIWSQGSYKLILNDNDVSIPRALTKEQLFKTMPVCEYIIINNFISTPTRRHGCY